MTSGEHALLEYVDSEARDLAPDAFSRFMADLYTRIAGMIPKRCDCLTPCLRTAHLQYNQVPDPHTFNMSMFHIHEMLQRICCASVMSSIAVEASTTMHAIQCDIYSPQFILD